MAADIAVTYRSIVVRIPPTTPRLLPERWTVDHWCNLCHQRAAPAQLIAHAQHHQQTGAQRLANDS